MALVVFPSPPIVEVIAITCDFDSLDINCKFVLKLLYASVKADLEDKNTCIFSVLSFLIDGIIPSKETVVPLLISTSYLILSSKNALKKARAIPNINPKIMPTNTISFLLGSIEFSGRNALSITLF